MSKLSHFGLRTLSAVAVFCAFTTVARCEEGGWQTDFEAAKITAKAEKKLLLVDFTGSDWCGWCIKLHKEVFDKDVFKEAAPKNFVLVELDFPHEKKLPEQLKAQNDKLAKKYDVHGFPTILLLDPEGEVVAHTGYRPGGPEKYVANLTKMVSLHDDVVKMEKQLADAKGLDRAKLLDRLVDATSELGSDEKADAWSKEIIELDADNKGGLKSKYEVRQTMAEISKLMQTRKFDDARKLVEEVLEKPGLSAEQKQEAYFAQGYLEYLKKELRPAIATFKKALAAAPDGPKAEQISNFIPALEGMLKGEEAALKAKTALEKAVGADRLKLLDAAIGAYSKIGNRIDGKDQSAEVAAWEKEIISLDADNKAGLKDKYESKVMLGEAQKLLMAHKIPEALAKVDKMLTISGASQEDIDRAMMMKCSCLMAQNDYQGAIDCAKKAQESAQGMMASIFKSIAKQAEAKLKAKDDAGKE